MGLHLITMAAGITSLQELEQRQTFLRTNEKDLIHVTRFFPKRADEILNDKLTPPGSLYWVCQKRI
ncbi:unnamed protein product, partial [Scytosiphon promiscuus]